jgi:inorganic triphosphatase YgiF
MEVSLDLGDLVSGTQTAPICELELELQAGQADALFEVALALSRTLAVLPLNASKSERGYALRQGGLPATCARPPLLSADLSINLAAQKVLREMFGQFTANLYHLLLGNQAEATHQARIGWRRFKSALRLFKPVLNPQAMPSWQDLQTVLLCLPALADAYKADDAQRAQHWQAMTQALELAARQQLADLRTALQAPAVGACLLHITQWLEDLSAPTKTSSTVVKLPESLTTFAKRRTGRLYGHLQHIVQSGGLDNAHQIRLLAKRLRYSLESLRPNIKKPCSFRRALAPSVMSIRRFNCSPSWAPHLTCWRLYAATPWACQALRQPPKPHPNKSRPSAPPVWRPTIRVRNLDLIDPG